MKTIVHVSQPNIRLNGKDGGNRPVLTTKDSKRNRYGHAAVILGPDGAEVARIVYRPDKPLSCGAKVWIETEHEVQVLDMEGNEIIESNVKQCYLQEVA
jgi:hypothetical protein